MCDGGAAEEHTNTFVEYYDNTQQSLEALSGMDEFLAGIYMTSSCMHIYTQYVKTLSKSRGQVLRLAGVLHVLFSLGSDNYGESVSLGNEEDGSDGSLSDIISDAAVKAAIDFTEVACQQTAYIGGRGCIKDEIMRLKSSKCLPNTHPKCSCPIKRCPSHKPHTLAADNEDGRMSTPLTDDAKNAAYCLNLPGGTLYLTPLLAAKKFRGRGNKDGAIRAFQLLEKDGLGKTFVFGSAKGSGTQVS